jgi:hypothetical protein
VAILTAIASIIAALPKIIELVMTLMRGNPEKKAKKARHEVGDQWEDFEKRYHDKKGNS